MDEWRRSGQVPAFGDWERANELPITQYFESARQAGLTRYSTNSSGECGGQFMGGSGDLYAVDFNKHSHNPAPPTKARLREKRGHDVKEQQLQRKQGKICAVTEPPRKPQYYHQQQKQQQRKPSISNNKCNNSNVSQAKAKYPAVRPTKAVDEDLYKIPPELLCSSKRKKLPGLFSCLVPACAS